MDWPYQQAPWAFHHPVRLIFGSGTFAKLPTLVAGRKVLLLTTPGFTRRGITRQLVQMLEPAVVRVMDDVPANPELSDLEARAQALARLPVEVIVAVGGGSVIDTGKVLSATLGQKDHGFDLRSYLESGASGLAGQGIPLLAVPTTAGTGSEVTPFATVWDGAAKKKHSLAGPLLYAEAAIVDPMLTLSVPRETTIATGLDAISQALEAVWNRNAIPITTLFATEALRNALPAIGPLADTLDDQDLRTKMAYASLLSGLAISHTRTAIAHSMSYPLTLHYGMPHGLACGFTLPAILSFNLDADDGRLRVLAEALGFGRAEDLAGALKALLQRLGVPELVRQYVPSLDAPFTLVGEMFTPNRASNNLRPVDEHAIKAILAEALRW